MTNGKIGFEGIFCLKTFSGVSILWKFKQLLGFGTGLGQDAGCFDGRPGLHGQLYGLFLQGLSLLAGGGFVHREVFYDILFKTYENDIESIDES